MRQSRRCIRQSCMQAARLQKFRIKLLNMINSVEAETTVNSGMTKESGIIGSVINGIRAGMSGITKLFK